MASSQSSISNYQLGEALGKGASAQVYKALNWTSGETVAIKQILISNIPKGELSDIMSEIDLLKNLNHQNIVKYRGFFKSDEYLYIILEYCENGSLQTISKRYGKFPEDLVAVYISQVLQGLIYLHSQGVIHRDIKGANILTNKDGTVKLADFGVSTMLPGHNIAANAMGAADGSGGMGHSPTAVAGDDSVVGSPYWKPMQALFRIVQDDMPPIPEGASAVVKDFLYQCFQKDPNLRISAKMLAKHSWMIAAQRQANSTEETNPGKRQDAESLTASQVAMKRSRPKVLIPKRNRMSRAAMESSNPFANGNTSSSVSGQENILENNSVENSASLSRRPLTTVYDQAIQRVQEWNAALNAGPKNPIKIVRRKANLHGNAPMQARDQSRSTSMGQSSSGGSLEAHLKSIADQPRAVWKSRLLENKTLPTTSKDGGSDIQDGSVWDDDFAGSPDIAKFTSGRQNKATKDEADDGRTIRPAKSPAASPALPSLISTTKKRTTRIDDISDTTRAGPTPLALSHGHSAGAVAQRPRFGPTQSPGSRSTSRSNSFRGVAPDDESSKRALLTLDKYAERDDEGYDDVFAADPEERFGSIKSNSSDPLRLNVKLSNKTWRDGDNEDDDQEGDDPFADIEDSFTAFDVEANLLRDKHAILCGKINDIIDDLQPTSHEEALRTASYELISLLEGSHELQDHFVTAHGMLAVLEVLEIKPSRDVTLNLLKIINMTVAADPGVMEHVCLTGGIPVVMNFISKRYSLETRLEASVFVKSLTSSALTLQMFISCRGIRMLVELLDEDYTVNKGLVISALEGIESVFNLQSPAPKNEFCRMFVREGITEPLSSALLNIVKDISPDAEAAKQRILVLLLLFCQTGQADARIRVAFGSRSFVISLLRSLPRLSPPMLLLALKSIKHLSTSQPLLEVLQNADAIRILLDLLTEKLGFPGMNEEAAQNGLLPILRQVVEINSPLKDFALPLLCDMANAGKSAKRQLWKVDGIQSIVTWLQEETAQVEDRLLEKSAIESLTGAFCGATGTSFDNILEPFAKMLRASRSLATGCARPTFVKRIAQALSRRSNAIAKLNLLRLTKIICESDDYRDGAMGLSDLAQIVERLSKQDDAVLVRELAREILPLLARLRSHGSNGSLNDKENAQRILTRKPSSGHGNAPLLERAYPLMHR
ncbi:hypothetical protein QFC21_002340 [Naganishia friedmannii]|uniref:Uncharacterized protein n=1 Tax=Naganishia friedmannii TaxID=89922 RepID=A0ACC2VXL1_9TREE|nr:hypothetical protein QFC21_002340 [Naganishia friedmannii]